MFRAVRLVIQTALLLQVLQTPTCITGLEVENFKNTELTSEDSLGTVAPAKIPDSADKNIEKQEERGFFSWLTGDDDDETTAPATETATTTTRAPSDTAGSSGDLATTTPIPSTAARPSTSSLMSKYGSLIGDLTSKTSSGSADKTATGAGSSASASSGSEEATPTTKKPTTKTKTKAPVASGSSESASGSEEATTVKTKKKKVAAAAASESSESASGSEEATTAQTKKKTTKKIKKVVDAESGSSSLDDLLGSDASGSDLDDLLRSSSGSDATLDDLLGGASGSDDDVLGSGSDELTALMGSRLNGFGGSGSGGIPSFEEVLKMMGSGSAALDLFGDPTEPQNNTVNEGDIVLSPLYGGGEHGDAFSDIQNIKFQQTILNVTIRGEERVDSVEFTVMNGDSFGTLVHGGTGGTEQFMELEMTDKITEIEIHWDKHKGQTCIFYISVTASNGKTISTGTKTDNSVVLKPPEDYIFGGYYGRSSSAGVFQLGAIWTNSTAADLTATDVMVLSSGTPDIYNYKTTIRNWVGPVSEASDTACYQKKVGVSSQNTCPSGYNKDDDKCITQCPLTYPVDCLMECIPQHADCSMEILAKVASAAAVALNAATLGTLGAFVAAYKVANLALTCAINIVNTIRSLIYYLRYRQTTIPQTDTQKLLDKAFQLQIVILDLPMTVCSCLGIKIPEKLRFTSMVLGLVSGLVMVAVMVGEAIFKSSDNVMLMLREVGVMNTTALSGSAIELDTFLNTKNGTCGYEVRTLTNRVIGKVYEIRNNTPNAAADDVRVEVSKSTIMTEDIPIVTNHCMGQIWTNHTQASAYETRNMLRKTLGVIIDQLIEDGTTDMGKNVVKNEKALEYANTGLFFLSVLDPTGIAWMATEFVQPICGPTNYIGEIDDGTLYDALGMNIMDQAFLGSYGVWKKKGDGSVKIFFESVDAENVKVVIHSGGDTIKEVRVDAGTNVSWESTVEELQDKTLYLDRWRPGLLGLPGSGGGSLLLWVPRSSEGGQLTLHARLNVS